MKIAYLAPEIPALSATFVYNEILALEELGNEILPVSVHKPHSEATESEVSELKKKVIYLYRIGKSHVLGSHAQLLIFHPLRYLKTLYLLFKDMTKQGLFTRAAAGLAYRFFFAGSLARILIDNQIQHLHVHFAHVPADIAMYAASMSGKGFSVTAHANDIFERGWLLREKIERARFFATISEFNQRYLVNEQHGDASKLHIIRCGVDTRVFSCKPHPAITSPVRIGMVGRLVEKKGIDTLIESMRLLTQKRFDATLNIAGSGPLENELKNKVSQSELADKVFFAGPLPHTEIAKFISSLDLFVLPCKKDSNGDMDGIPVVLMEAMMSGVPVISTKISGIPELVVNEMTGLTVEAANAEQLADAIIKISRDETLQHNVINAAANKVNEEFSLMVNAQRLNDLFMTAVQAD